LRGPRTPRNALITEHNVVKSSLLWRYMNRDLHFVAHNLICLCAMFMKFMEILVSRGESSSALQVIDLALPGVAPPLNFGLTVGMACMPRTYSVGYELNELNRPTTEPCTHRSFVSFAVVSSFISSVQKPW